MKYVIKEVKSNAHYVKSAGTTSFFDVAYSLDEAHKYESIEACINAIVAAAETSKLTRFTIVGVKESMKIHYEEVEL